MGKKKLATWLTLPAVGRPLLHCHHHSCHQHCNCHHCHLIVIIENHHHNHFDHCCYVWSYQLLIPDCIKWMIQTVRRQKLLQGFNFQMYILCIYSAGMLYMRLIMCVCVCLCVYVCVCVYNVYVCIMYMFVYCICLYNVYVCIMYMFV